MNQIAKASAAIGSVKVRPMSMQVAEVRSHINLIQEAMRTQMKDGTHFGTIPGCPKKSLFKPGAELIMAMFKLSGDPIPTDLSKDGEIRYQVRVDVKSKDGSYLGSGLGECSSQEEKYMWRAAVCQEEFDITPETRRRIKFRKDFRTGGIQQIQQIRVNPGELANTILKMAVKRAMVAACLQTTACSDIFTQDIEDLPEGYVSPEAQEMPQAAPQEATETTITPKATPTPAPTQTAEDIAFSQDPVEDQKPARPAPENPISEPQRKRLYAIAMGAGMSKDRFKEFIEARGYASSRDISKDDYDQICADAQNYNPVRS